MEEDGQQQHEQEEHFQPPPQQFDFPQPPPQNFPQEYNWQELTQQFQGIRVEQNNQFNDFFERQNSFLEDMLMRIDKEKKLRAKHNLKGRNK
ncbi:hypothetical protein PIB30_035283 [Stylosanthes scabra]|uniref:Uncharacterized protein n=1 Tax=Stylosanthes scabra TaxID=79078 RepID=A0ABU6YAA8_9FABA|nr:hypothetical protein [Stylosanthes scabra]